MNGRTLLKYWKNKYDESYSINQDLYGFPKLSKEWYTRRDSVAHVIYLLKQSEDITKEEQMNLLNLLHSPDQENWTVVECIIETINTDKQLPNTY